jgi:septum formation protein
MSGEPRALRRLLGLDDCRVVLASASPRRRALLESLGLDPVVRPAGVLEEVTPDRGAAETAERLARRKALAVARDPGEVVIAADTLVVVDRRILGKPADDREARTMLELLSGREHVVVTGVCVRRGEPDRLASGTETTRVRFEPLDERDLEYLVSTGDWRDKAGGYGIQSAAAPWITGIQGDYWNVVGLPLVRLRRLLRHTAGGRGTPGREGS